MLWSCTVGSRGAFHHRFARRRLHRDGLLHQTEKQLAPAAICPTIEPERELVQVVVQRLVADRASVGAQQPALEQRYDAMNARHQLRRRFPLAPQERHPVEIAFLFQGQVAQPAVGVNHAAGLQWRPPQTASGSLRRHPVCGASEFVQSPSHLLEQQRQSALCFPSGARERPPPGPTDTSRLPRSRR